MSGSRVLHDILELRNHKRAKFRCVDMMGRFYNLALCRLDER
jgi:hypothetical protein